MPASTIESVTPSGVRCQLSEKSTAFAAWEEISSVGAFKRDRPDGILTCLWIRTPNQEFPIEVESRDLNWNHLVAGIAEYLPDAKPVEKWFPEALHPTLEINIQNVYEKET
jgi:hypothetical protein